MTSARTRFATVTMCVTWLLFPYPSLLVEAHTTWLDPTWKLSGVKAPLPTLRKPVDRRDSHRHAAVWPAGVGVTTDKEAYRAAETIGVSITNGLDQTVQGSSQYSYCTIVTLEQKQDDSWKPLAPCALLRMAANLDIEPGETAQLRLPASEQLEPRRQAGTYRIAFIYDVLDRERLKHLSQGIVHSEPFTVIED